MENTGVRIQESEVPLAPAGSFRDLKVWQKAHQWILEIYRLTYQFPSEEKFGLTSQLRRAAVSVPANIVEGFRRRGRAEKIRFLNIAEASLDEARYFLLLAADLSFAETAALESKADEIARMLTAYSKAIQNSHS